MIYELQIFRSSEVTSEFSTEQNSTYNGAEFVHPNASIGSANFTLEVQSIDFLTYEEFCWVRRSINQGL